MSFAELTSVCLSQAVDPGGSIFLHTFGAYFGLALAFALHRKDHLSHRNEGSSYTSDVFAMIGQSYSVRVVWSKTAFLRAEEIKAAQL